MSLTISQKCGLIDLQCALTAAAAGSKVKCEVGKAATNQPYFKVGERVLTNSGAICRFLAHGTALLPSSMLDQAKMDQVLDLTSTTVMSMVEGGGPLDKVVKALPTPFSGFFAGPAVSIADIAVFAALYPTGSSAPTSLGSLEPWFNSIATLPWVKDTLKTLKVTKGSNLHVAKPMKGTAKASASAKASAAPSSGKTSKAKRVGRKDRAWGPKVPLGHTSFSWGRNAKKAAAAAGSSSSSSSSSSSNAPAEAEEEVVDPSKPILPVEGKRNILITSALPYVNNVPHLGNIIGCVLSADVYARFCRLRGHNAIYICGTDEYGTATETKALQAGMTPQQICNKYHKIHKEIYEWFNIKFDKFGRTTTKHQTMIAQDIFNKIEANDRIVAQDVTQLWCEKLGFLADRFVEGTCPKCGYDDARGDQCDSCGTLLNAIELINPRAKLDPTAVITTKTSRHLFLDLPKISTTLEEFVKEASVKGQWSSNSTSVTNSWLKEGLKPRCITRDLKWGTPVPAKGFEDKVFYVWFDAPIGYISITADYTDEWEQWWKSKDVELVQFMGKDNIPFHTVIFPSSLIAADDNYTMLHHINTTEYLNYETGKFSKSRGVGVFGDDAKATGVPSEVWRYYLLSNRPEASDSVFLWKDFAAKLNCELVANLGNLVNRVMTFTSKQFEGVVPDYSTLTPDDEVFVKLIKDARNQYIETLEGYKIKDGLRNTMIMSKAGNAYMQANAPWVLIKSDRGRCGTVLGVLLNMCFHLAVMLEPYMPAFTENLCKQLNMTVKRRALAGDFAMHVPGGHRLGTPCVLFQKIAKEDEWVEEMRSKYGGQQAAEGAVVFPLSLVVGKVVEVTEHPSADTLFVLKVDIGEPKGPRTICSGLKAHYTKEQLEGQSVVVLSNGKTAKLKGVRSQGMILTGMSGDTIKLMTSTKPAGTKVTPEGCEVKVVKNYNIRKEYSKLDMKLQEGSGNGAFNGMALQADGEPITCSIKTGGDIK